MPRKLGLVCQRVDRVVVNVKAACRALDHDAARGVGDDPMQKRFGLPRRDGRDELDVFEGPLDFVHGFEVSRHPKRELERGDVAGALDASMRELRAAGEVQARDGQSSLVRAVEIQRVAVHDRADAHDGEGRA